MLRRATAVVMTMLATTVVGIVLTETSASASHAHYVATPNGECHEVAEGQTSISEGENGGYHRYHEHVHLGATGDPGTSGDDNLGQGNGEAKVYKEGPAPAECDGS